jgi:hypothetical protein
MQNTNFQDYFVRTTEFFQLFTDLQHVNYEIYLYEKTLILQTISWIENQKICKN